MAKKRKIMKKKVTKKKTSKRRAAKKVAKKSTKKKSRVMKKAKATKKAAITAAPEMMGQLHEHSAGHNEPIDNPISKISDNETEHGLKDQSTVETDDFGAKNDTDNLD